MKKTEVIGDYQALRAEYVSLCRKRGNLAYAQSKLDCESESWQAGHKLHEDMNERIETLRSLLEGRV